MTAMKVLEVDDEDLHAAILRELPAQSRSLSEFLEGSQAMLRLRPLQFTGTH